jgi:PPK2 family polyphosphate:nucleotide phosphotransferase
VAEGAGREDDSTAKSSSDAVKPLGAKVAGELADRLRVKPGSRVSLSRWDPNETFGHDKGTSGPTLERGLERLHELQERLFAATDHALLVIAQGMDTSGKDGVLKHVMGGGFNPQGVSVTSFGVPSPEERLHDFLWRHHVAAPRRGYVGIHNRSHYESVLVERVAKLVPSSTWRRRYEQINEWEAELSSEGTTIVKLYLNIDRDEQKERLQDRLDDPTKHWKFNPDDLKVRAQWDDYMGAYEDALSRCSTDVAPWYVVPANRKWFRNLAVAEILVATMDTMKLRYPPDAFDPKAITIE